MRAINVLLAILVSLLLAAFVLEVGLRLIGQGPKPTINRFDEHLGWVKTPGASARRKTGEFDVRYTVNSLGLRDDEMSTPGKPNGIGRVVFLGDSFVLGYTVDRDDLFVDLLERWWKAEGRPLEAINGGTEGWSTDQEVLWYQRYGKDYAPDLVVLCPYENDIFWNGQPSYLRFPKPRYEADGTLEKRTLLDPGPEGTSQHWAIGKLFGPKTQLPMWSPDGTHELLAEWSVYFHPTPAQLESAYARTRGALRALKETVEARGARLLVAPIPNKACIQESARESLVNQIAQRDLIHELRRKLRGEAEPEMLTPEHWSPDEPVERVLALCQELSIQTVDARPALKSAASGGDDLYYRADWHFNPAGNRAFARFLHDEVDRLAILPAPLAAKTHADLPPPAPAPFVRGWMITFAALLLILSAIYRLTYPKDPVLKGVAICGGMLTLIFTIAIGGGALLSHLSPQLALVIGAALLLTLLIFILVKLGRRLSTVIELFVAFTRRGHWYLMPLVVVLLTVGSLLVVAASSPLVAPFIYTLF